MSSLHSIIAVIAGILGIVLTLLKILELSRKLRLPRIVRELLSSATVAWVLLAVALVGFSAHLLAFSGGLLSTIPGFQIEEAAVTTWTYQGGGGWGYLSVTSGVADRGSSTRYDFNYGLPDGESAYAGFSLEFSEPQDLTEYGLIELTIGFGDDRARCRLCIDDSFGDYGCVVLGDGSISEMAV